jgi:hypothetical protein
MRSSGRSRATAEPGPTERLRRLGDATAQRLKQVAKHALFVHLGRVIRRPLLAVRHAGCLGNPCRATGVSLASDGELHSPEMLALQAPGSVIETGTRPFVGVNDVCLSTRLARDFPARSAAPELHEGRDLGAAFLSALQSLKFSSIHSRLSRRLYTGSIYYRGLTCQYSEYIFGVDLSRKATPMSKSGTPSSVIPKPLRCRCGHEWYPRRPGDRPTVCPKCKSPNWDKPYKFRRTNS